MDIFNRDLSRKAFEDGLRDGESGKDKDQRGALKSWKTWVFTEAALGSYGNAYDKGYALGLAKKSGLLWTLPESPLGAGVAGPPTPTGAPAMSNATSFAHQIELLQNLKQYLVDFQERLLGVSGNYQRKVDALHGEGGLMDETYRDFVEGQLEPTRALIAQLVEHIGANDIPAVEKDIAYLEQML